MKPQIDSDGTTVWVNAPDGSCLGRFGTMGIDIHRAWQDQLDGGSQCLMCTHGTTGAMHWEQFVQGMKHHHGVTVGERHRPKRLAAAANDA